MRRKLFLAMTLLTTVLACAQAPASEARPTTDPASYVIGPQDVLQIDVWKEPEMSAAAVPVRLDGRISLPLLADIQAAGLTPMQLGAALTEKVKKFVQDPQVTVVVTAINSKRVYVIGEVQHPGPLMMQPEMNVLQALSSAGGLSQYANAKKIYVLRAAKDGPQRIRFNYKAALKGEAQQNLDLQSGDTIVVP